jgi:hypothetical protein
MKYCVIVGRSKGIGKGTFCVSLLKEDSDVK